MSNLHNYEISIQSADARQRVDDFIRDQKKITQKVKRDIKSTLGKKKLSGEFNYVTSRTSNTARTIHVRATAAVAAELRKIENVKQVIRRVY